MPRSFLITNKRYRSEDNNAPSTSVLHPQVTTAAAVEGTVQTVAGTVAGTVPGTAAAYYVPSEFPYHVVRTPVYPEEPREDEDIDFSSSDAMSRGKK